MLQIALAQQPPWFRPLLNRSPRLKRLLGYGHWSRAWEYPWAIQVSDLGQHRLRTLDVGGGGSPFGIYLAKHGHESFIVDPSLDKGLNLSFNKDKTLLRNMRSLVFELFLRVTGINRMWGRPMKKGSVPLFYYPYSATDLKFPDDHFDRLFCLSVMEHIPVDLWPACIREFERVLKPGGRLAITFDMSTPDANDRQYLTLINSSSHKLLGNPHYEVPISPADKQLRHPGQTYETMGLVWQG